MSPNLVLPLSNNTEELTYSTCISLAVIVPSTYKSVLTLNALFSNDALILPFIILFNSSPVTPVAGILYNPEPSPTNELEIVSLTFNEPVISVSTLILKPSICDIDAVALPSTI